jgi:hypothetical protein
MALEFFWGVGWVEGEGVWGRGWVRVESDFYTGRNVLAVPSRRIKVLKSISNRR